MQTISLLARESPSVLKFFSMGFGAWLRAHRRDRAMSQADLAEAVSSRGVRVTSAYISNLEREYDTNKAGKPTRPSEILVDAIAEALGADIDDARLAAGYAPEGPLFALAPNVSIKLADKNLTDEDRKEILEELELAYRVILQRRAERNTKD